MDSTTISPGLVVDRHSWGIVPETAKRMLFRTPKNRRITQIPQLDRCVNGSLSLTDSAERYRIFNKPDVNRE